MSLLGLGCVNTILTLAFALYEWNAWKCYFDCKIILKNLFRGGVFRETATIKRPTYFQFSFNFFKV